MKKLLILLLLSVSASAQITLNLTSQNRTDLASLSDSLAAKQNKITGLTTNYLPKVGANGVLVNSIISEDDFRVGVGFANPVFTFDVRQVSPYTYNRASFGGMSPDGSSHAYMLIPPNGGGFFDVIRRNNTALRFATETSLGFGFSTQMTLTADGKLGVKTPDPTHDFHVNGTTRTNKLLVNKSTDSGEIAQFNGTVQANALKVTGLTTNYLPKVGADGLLGNSQVFDNGTNVGVGTINPRSLVDVAGLLSVGNGASGVNTEAIRFVRPDNFRFQSIYTTSSGSPSGNLVQFFLHNGTTATAQTAVMTLRGDGRVGVKTIDPTHDFHVNGTTRTTKLLINQSTDSGEPLQVTGNIRVTNATDGIILKTPDGTKTFKLTIDNTGNIVSTQQ